MRYYRMRFVLRSKDGEVRVLMKDTPAADGLEARKKWNEYRDSLQKGDEVMDSSLKEIEKKHYCAHHWI